MPYTCAVLALVLLNFLQPGGHDEQRAFQILFLLASAALFALTSRAATLPGLLSNGTRSLLGAFFILGCASALTAFAPRFACYEVANLFLLLMLALAVAAEIAPDPANNLLRVLQVLGAVCLLYAVRIATLYVTSFVVRLPPDALDLTPGFSNYRFFNHVQTVALPLLVLLFYLTPHPGRMRWAWFALASFWWAMLGVTAARGTMLGELVACLGVACMRRRHALSFMKAMAATALAGAAFYLVCFMLLPALAGMGSFGELGHIVERTAADPASGRERLWKLSIELIPAHPWLGVGPLHFAHYGADVRTGAHPHNWAFQIAAEWGLPAFLCLVAAIARAVIGLIRTSKAIPAGDAPSHAVLAAMLTAALATLADGLVSGSLVMPQTQLLIAVYIGCALGWASKFRKQEPAQARQPWTRRTVGAIVIVAAAVGVAGATLPDLFARLRHEPLEHDAAALNQGVQWPRLWLAGYF